MPVSYKKIWIVLIQKGITKIQVRKMADISPATMTKLNKDKYVALSVLTKICNALACDIGDVVETVK